MKETFFYHVGKKKASDTDPSVISKERLEEIKMSAAKYDKENQCGRYMKDYISSRDMIYLGLAILAFFVFGWLAENVVM